MANLSKDRKSSSSSLVRRKREVKVLNQRMFASIAESLVIGLQAVAKKKQETPEEVAKNATTVDLMIISNDTVQNLVVHQADLHDPHPEESQEKIKNLRKAESTEADHHLEAADPDLIVQEIERTKEEIEVKVRAKAVTEVAVEANQRKRERAPLRTVDPKLMERRMATVKRESHHRRVFVFINAKE
mmetsp:Transcript_34780/g.40676  ORF Transcript_34780/g.40676 Transcript_34780/m.40676 type:complete len:187 (+) Transcript_34780:205-765(+)